MSKTPISERKLSANHEADASQTILYNLAWAWHVIAADQVAEALAGDINLPLKQQEALCLIAAREMLYQLQSSLIAAPQSSQTSKILEPLSQAGIIARQQIESRFPSDEEEEKRLAALIARVRANIETSKTSSVKYPTFRASI